MSAFSVTQSQLVLNNLPTNKKYPIIENYLDALLTPAQWLNTNFTNYVYGSTYSIYSPTASYSIGTFVNGGINYNNGVYQCIATSSGSSILTSSIFAGGYGYFAGDYFSIGLGSAIGKVLTAHNPSGFTINITHTISGGISTTTLNSGGSGYSVADRFWVQGGFSLAAGIVLTVGGSGNVLTYEILSAGTGYVTSIGSVCTLYVSYAGIVDTYVIENPGTGYIPSLTYSTTTISGVGIGLNIEVLTVGGAQPPSNSLYWYEVNKSFIGVEERSLMTNNEITLTWALNRYFGTTFRQPSSATQSWTQSDIYINDLPNTSPSCFLISPSSLESSSVYPGGSSQQFYPNPGIPYGFNNFFGNYNVMVPKSVLNTIPGGSSSVVDFVNKYNAAGISFNVVGY